MASDRFYLSPSPSDTLASVNTCCQATGYSCWQPFMGCFWCEPFVTWHPRSPLVRSNPRSPYSHQRSVLANKMPFWARFTFALDAIIFITIATTDANTTAVKKYG